MTPIVELSMKGPHGGSFYTLSVGIATVIGQEVFYLKLFKVQILNICTQTMIGKQCLPMLGENKQAKY